MPLDDRAGTFWVGGVCYGAVEGGFVVGFCEGVGDAGGVWLGEGVVYGVVEALGLRLAVFDYGSRWTM